MLDFANTGYYTKVRPGGASLDRIKLVFEDESVIVVDKPAGLLTMATDTERSRTVYAELRRYANNKRPEEKIFIVHRLDREASGWSLQNDRRRKGCRISSRITVQAGDTSPSWRAVLLRNNSRFDRT